MDKKKDKREVIAVRLFNMFLIIYIVLYIAKETGYYNVEVKKQTVLNEEAMKRFEEDIRMGKNVKMTDYVSIKNIKYNNKVSDLGYDISKGISYIVTNGLDDTMSFLGQLFTS